VASYTYSAVGNKEDVNPIIENISPRENLLITKFGKKQIKSVYHEWLLDDVRPAQPNVQLEKATFTVSTATARRRMGNAVQHFMHGYEVSDAQEEVAKYGVGSEMDYQMTKAYREISGDLEYGAKVQASAPITAGAGTAPKMAGMQYYIQNYGVVTPTSITTSVTLITATSDPVYHIGEQVSVYGTGCTSAGLTKNGIYYAGPPASGTAISTQFTLFDTPEHAQAYYASGSTTGIVTFSATTTGTVSIALSNLIVASASLSETLFNDMLQKGTTRGAKFDSALVSGKNKRTISTWTAGTMKTRSMEDTKLKMVVDVYESDFGIVDILWHRMQTDDRIDFIEWQYWALCYLKNFKDEATPRVGTYEQRVITGSCTIECKSPASNGAITNLS
jgi:hypothetical protein